MNHKPRTYHSQMLADFVRQLLFTPKSKRPEQIAHTEALHDLIEPDQNYPFDFVNHHITGYHSESESVDDATILVGQALLPDLRQIIDVLCLSAESLPDDEPLTELATLAQQLHVSTKTIHRWRDLGLRWRRYRHPSLNRMVLGFTASALENFDKKHPGRLAHAAEHDQMSQEQLATLLESARLLVTQSPDLSLNQVAQLLCEQTQRAVQTLRLQLEKHDRQHPQAPLFPNHHGPLTDRQARQITRLKQQGISHDELCKRYGKTTSTIRRAIVNARLQVIQRLPIKPPRAHESYTDPTHILQYRSLLIRDSDWQDLPTQLPSDLPAMLNLWFAQSQLKPANQLQYFQWYQFLRFTAHWQSKTLHPNVCTATQIKQLESDIRQAGQLRDLLTTACLPVVVSVARKHMDHLDGRSVYVLQDLLILGCQILFAELDLFDPHRKQSFDTYLTWQLQKSFATWLSDAQRASRANKRLTSLQVITRIKSQATYWGIRLPAMPSDIA
ncbi:hypothetical protein JYU15_01020 [bacterium AH-315-I18]|nr:hypothetical protein [bacterium AH-315-I18]